MPDIPSAQNVSVSFGGTALGGLIGFDEGYAAASPTDTTGATATIVGSGGNTRVIRQVEVTMIEPGSIAFRCWGNPPFGRADIGLMGAALQGMGIDYSYTGNATHAWLTVLLMDVWHWTPLVALLGYAGLRAIPDAYYQAARIDGASKWAVFWYVQLPKMRGVLVIAVLLRFMDSFMIYTEPFVLTGGGPGNSTTFLSQFLTQKAVGQFDLGPAAAFSLIYFLIILLLCFVLFNWMQRVGTQPKEGGNG